jgi:glutathionyl-hydroquinone reductase
MTGMFVEGEWKTGQQLQRENGHFKRATTTFRDWIPADGSTGFAAESGHYHLYIAWACPWAHRTAIMRRLKGLEDDISMSVVGHFMADGGWSFEDEPGVVPDTVNGAH